MDIADASRAVVELYRYSDMHSGRVPCGECGFEDTRALRDFVEEIPSPGWREVEIWNTEVLSRQRRARLHLPGQ